MVDGFKACDSAFFIAVELMLNILIIIDLTCRVRMVGFKKYLRKNWWNKLDFFMVLGCNTLFVVSIIYKYHVEEISEELLLTFWSAF